MDNKEFDFHDIKTFEDACKRLGISAESLLVDSLGDTEAFLQANALYKLMIIQKAINNDKWRDKDGWSYYPYWVPYAKEDMKRMSDEEMRRIGIRQISSCAVALDTEFRVSAVQLRVIVVCFFLRIMVSPYALTAKNPPSTQPSNLRAYSSITTELK